MMKIHWTEEDILWLIPNQEGIRLDTGEWITIPRQENPWWDAPRIYISWEEQFQPARTGTLCMWYKQPDRMYVNVGGEWILLSQGPKLEGNYDSLETRD